MLSVFMIGPVMSLVIAGNMFVVLLGLGRGYRPLSLVVGGNIGSSHRFVSGSVTNGMYRRHMIRPGFAVSRLTRCPDCVACRTEYRRRTQSGTTSVVLCSMMLVYIDLSSS